MGRFPRLSHLSLIGAAGLAAMLLLPGDDTRPPAASLKVAGGGAPQPALATSAPPVAAEPPQAGNGAAAAPEPEPADSTPAAVPSLAPGPDESEAAIEETVPQRTLWVGRSAVNVRAGPSATTARLFVLRPGQKVTAGETAGNWTLITADDGDSGWVSSRYLSDSATPPKATPPPRAGRAPATAAPEAGTEEALPVRRVTFARVGSRVTLRSRPSAFSARLLVLEPGDRIAVIETRGRWVRVLLENGMSAWADSRDL